MFEDLQEVVNEVLVTKTGKPVKDLENFLRVVDLDTLPEKKRIPSGSCCIPGKPSTFQGNQFSAECSWEL